MKNRIQLTFDHILKRFGYVRATTVRPEIIEASPAVVFLDNGKVIFPTPTDKNGRPIQFEPGVSYIVSRKGRWRRRRTFKDKPEPNDDVSPGVPETAGSVEKHQPYVPTEHQAEYSRLYRRWVRMMSGCYDPNHSDYHLYGARGVTVSEEWKEFDQFKADLIALGNEPFNRVLALSDPHKPFGPHNIRFLEGSLFRKLEAADVVEIRSSGETTVAAAKRYGVSQTVISKIRRRLIYREIP